jgi:transcriptional regulator with XRE-family HTH domain
MKRNKPESDTSINIRLLEIRKTKGFTQEEFADRIKIGRSMIGSIEEGRREVKDRLISLVCLTFGANEHWIRTGKGAMFDNPKNERLAGRRILAGTYRLPERHPDNRPRRSNRLGQQAIRTGET